MPDPPVNRTTMPLSPAQRDWIRRQGRISRALEAAQRRSSGRFSRTAAPPPQPAGVRQRTPRFPPGTEG